MSWKLPLWNSLLRSAIEQRPVFSGSCFWWRTIYNVVVWGDIKHSFTFSFEYCRAVCRAGLLVHWIVPAKSKSFDMTVKMKYSISAGTVKTTWPITNMSRIVSGWFFFQKDVFLALLIPVFQYLKYELNLMSLFVEIEIREKNIRSLQNLWHTTYRLKSILLSMSDKEYGSRRRLNVNSF